jgi:hypothetical protein
VTWRWETALYARARRENLDRHDDGVKAAAKLQLAAERAGPPDVETDGTRYGPLADAYGFWLSGSTARAHGDDRTDPYVPLFGPLSAEALAVAQLEGLVLTGLKPEGISKRTGLSVPAVAWYERLWFDVRDRLKRRGWVATAVIGTLHQGSLGSLLPALVRAYGYYTKSPRVVEAVVSGFDGPATRSAARSPEAFFAADALAAGGLKAALAVRLMPLTDRRTHARVIELHQEATKIAADAALVAGSENENQLRDAIGKLQTSVQFRYGKAPPGAAHGPLRLSAHDDPDVKEESA